MQKIQLYKQSWERKLVFSHSYLVDEEVSKYKEAYQKFFKSCANNIETLKNHINLLYVKLQKSGIHVDQKIFRPFNFKILNFSPNFEVVEIKIQWGFYSIQAHILSIIGESLFHSCNSECGSNAKVYHIQNLFDSFSVKCVKNTAPKPQITARLKRKALQEYFIFRIASALECGPYLKKYFGFDLLMTEQCIEFALQNCKKIKILTSEGVEELKGSLYILHRMNIVHFDIKPENLMWSNHFKHEIMIDFGLSQIFKGEYGYKYLTTFKGSPNYCSPEMATLLANQYQNHVDIYYNDVYCLNESIKNFRNHLLDESSDYINEEIFQIVTNHNICDYYQQNYNQQSQFWNQSQINKLDIIKVKFYIFTKNKQKISQIYIKQGQRSNIFSGEILSFIKDNCDAYSLKQIYLKYISDAIKESVQNGWINRWAKSIYPKTSMLSQQEISENKIVFQQILNNLKEISRQQNYNLENICKSELESFLFVSQVSDYQVYFYMFASYISFINNCHKVNIKEKLSCCIFFVQALMKQVGVSPADDLIIQEEIILDHLFKIYNFILDYYISGKMGKKNTFLGNQKRLSLLINIIQHIFIFSLLTTQQSIQILNSIYGLKFWSQLQRLQFIITIININDWNLVPLFRDKSVSVIQIQLWFSQKYLQLGKQKLILQCRLVYDQFKRLQAKQDFDVSNDHYFLKQLPSSFRQQIWLSQLPKQLVKDSQYPILRIQQFMSLALSHAERGKILPIYFHFFVLFHINYKNLEESLAICQIFKKNLLSEYFYQRLIYIRIINSSNKLSLQEKISNTIFFAKIIKLENIGFMIIVLSRELIALIQSMKTITLSQIKKSNDLSQLGQQLQNICKRIDFHYELRDLNRKCENKQYVYYYFTIRSKIHEVFRKPYDSLGSQIRELQIVIKKLKCEKCRRNMFFQLMRQQHEEIMFSQRKNSAEKLITLLKDYLLSESNDKYRNSIYSNDLIFQNYVSVVGKLITLSYDRKSLSQIIIQFYQFSKEKKILGKYLENRQNSNIISLTLSAIMELQGIQQMLFFLGESVRFLRFTENNIILSSMIRNYQTFFSQAGGQQFCKSSVFEYWKMQRESEYYAAAIYYSLNQEEILTYLIIICKLIQYMPSKIISYFQVLIYKHITLHRQNFCTKFIDVEQRPNTKRSKRKIDNIQNKLIKLLSAHYDNHTNFYTFKQKQNKIMPKKLLFLRKASEKIGSFKIREKQNKIFVLKLT